MHRRSHLARGDVTLPVARARTDDEQIGGRPGRSHPCSPTVPFHERIAALSLDCSRV
jgi:hypothetical protein